MKFLVTQFYLRTLGGLLFTVCTFLSHTGALWGPLELGSFKVDFDRTLRRFGRACLTGKVFFNPILTRKGGYFLRASFRFQGFKLGATISKGVISKGELGLIKSFFLGNFLGVGVYPLVLVGV